MLNRSCLPKYVGTFQVREGHLWFSSRFCLIGSTNLTLHVRTDAATELAHSHLLRFFSFGLLDGLHVRPADRTGRLREFGPRSHVNVLFIMFIGNGHFFGDGNDCVVLQAVREAGNDDRMNCNIKLGLLCLWKL